MSIAHGVAHSTAAKYQNQANHHPSTTDSQLRWATNVRACDSVQGLVRYAAQLVFLLLFATYYVCRDSNIIETYSERIRLDASSNVIMLYSSASSVEQECEPRKKSELCARLLVCSFFFLGSDPPRVQYQNDVAL